MKSAGKEVTIDIEEITIDIKLMRDEKYSTSPSLLSRKSLNYKFFWLSQKQSTFSTSTSMF